MEVESPQGLTRRTLVKRGVVIGGALWTIPAIEMMGTRTAAAASASGGGGTPPPTPGTITGYVYDATKSPGSNAVAGATVSVGAITTTTGADGSYTLSGVPAGTDLVAVAATGFITTSANVTVPSGGSASHDFYLTPLGKLSFVLTWGATPSDLDLHASGPDGSGGRFHVYYGDKNPVPFVSQDVDDTTSYGPETDTISVYSAAGGHYVAGTYDIWVHDYSGPSFVNSDAQVVLTDPAGNSHTWQVADAAGYPDDAGNNIWKVATFDLAADGTVSNIVAWQSFTSGSSGTVL